MASLSDFAEPVYKSFQQPDLMMGLKKNVFVVIFMGFLVITAISKVIYGAVAGLLLYIPALILTKIDPDMLEIAAQSLLEPENLEG